MTVKRFHACGFVDVGLLSTLVTSSLTELVSWITLASVLYFSVKIALYFKLD